MLFLFSVAYLAAHFGIYAVMLRARAPFRTERGIFLYHAVSYGMLGLSVLLAGALRRDPASLPALVFAAGLHGVYSLSFLELWSLSQGSYSLQILEVLDRDPGIEPAGLARLGVVGRDKQADRRQDLLKLGMVDRGGNLTLIGRGSALCLRLLLWLSNGRPTN